MPVASKWSMWSVTTSARPALMASYRSASGIRHIRWSQGLYRGLKWVSTSYPAGRLLIALRRSSHRTNPGALRDNAKNTASVRALYMRTTR